MHIKHMHEMIEKLAEYGKQMVDEGTGNGEVNLEATKCVIEMVEKLAKAEYHARISKAMEEVEKEDEEEAKYIMKKMKEEYGEEEGERRFYDNYRYKSSGRFAPKGKGSYMPRRGFEQPMGYGMMPEIYNPMEWNRDMDRMDGRMYYSGGGSSSSGMSGNMGGSTRGYEEGYSDGNRRGYEEGYRQGTQNGKGNSNYDNARRGYSEGKQEHKGNTPEDNTENMRNLEKLLGVVGGDIRELKPGMSQQEKAMTAQKLETWARELKQA